VHQCSGDLPYKTNGPIRDDITLQAMPHLLPVRPKEATKRARRRIETQAIVSQTKGKVYAGAVTLICIHAAFAGDIASSAANRGSPSYFIDSYYVDFSLTGIKHAPGVASSPLAARP